MQQLIATQKIIGLRWLLYSALCLILLTATSCADDADNNVHNSSHSKPVCTEDTQCPKSQLCNRGYCTLEASHTAQLGLTFIPPHSTSYQPQRIEPFSIESSTSLQIGLKASILVHGNLNYKDSTLPGPSGILSFLRSGDHTGFHSQQTRVEAGKFEIYLLPGDYTLSLTPDEASIPGFSWPNESFTSDTEFKRLLPNPNSILTVQGNITFQSLTENNPAENAKEIPIEEVRVMATSSKGLASTATTTNDIGHFVLNVWPETGSYNLHVTPIHANSLVPSVVIREAFTAESKTILAPQTLGTYPSTVIPTQIRLTPADTNTDASKDELTNIDWSQTTVLLHANIGQGSIKLTPQVSNDGLLDFKALEGQYTVEIIPPLDSRYARTTSNHDLSATNNVFNIDIPLKKNIRGTVYDSEGNPVENAKIKCTPRGTRNPQIRSNAEARTITVTTDSNGQFNTWLEHTTYQLSVTPLSNSGLPRAFTTINTANPDFDTDSFIISIPSPVIIYGTLYEENGRQPMPNVSIQGYDTIDEQPRIIAEGITNARGEFVLVTPAPPPNDSIK